MKLSAAAIVAGCGVAALAVLPLAMPPYYVGLMIPFYGYAIALLGFNLLFGYTGLLSFGHAMFLGVGAYGAAILSSVLGVKSFELVLLTVMLASCAIALPVGALCVRYTGIFFGMLTLAFGMLFHSFLFKFYYLTGGDSGMRVARMTSSGWISRATTRSSSWPGLLLLLPRPHDRRRLRDVADRELAVRTAPQDRAR
jgi:ABC-type branched-chain amino acid transport system, permease component